MDRFRVLCAVREGPGGTVTVNRTAMTVLQQAGRIPPASPWYPGRPVLVARNDYRLGLFNGDTGITWTLAPGSAPRVFENQGNLVESDRLEHRAALLRMRAALDTWIAETGDRGEIPEPNEIVAPFVQEMHDWFGTPDWVSESD